MIASVLAEVSSACNVACGKVNEEFVSRPVQEDVRYGRTADKGNDMSMKLYVGNLAYSTTDETLRTMFGEFGDVQSAQVVMDRDTGRSKGFGFVEMSTDQASQAAMAGLNGKDVSGRQLTVNEAKPREDRGRRSGGYSSGRARY